MANQYDIIGQSYESLKRFPTTKLERNTFQSAVTPFLTASKDVKILDLACGTGYYTRLLYTWGSTHIKQILGIDLSSVMVSVAREALSPSEAEEVNFRVGDCIQPLTVTTEEGSPFDIVTGAWLLNYASSPAEMTAMFRNISTNLKAGGVFVGITPHPAPDLDAFVDQFDEAKNPSWMEHQRKYGVRVSYTESLPSGKGYRAQVTAYTTPREFEFESYHLRREVYEESARAGGMQGEIRWVEPTVPHGNEESVREYRVGRDWWEEYVTRKHFGILVVWK